MCVAHYHTCYLFSAINRWSFVVYYTVNNPPITLVRVCKSFIFFWDVSIHPWYWRFVSNVSGFSIFSKNKYLNNYVQYSTMKVKNINNSPTHYSTTYQINLQNSEDRCIQSHFGLSCRWLWWQRCFHTRFSFRKI